MNILGIETSCDETAAALVTDGFTVRSSVIASQIAAHAGFGGVVPEIAAREHLKAIDHVVAKALHDAGTELAAVDAIAVTHLPGLVPALLVGVAYAKGLAWRTGHPLLGVNHVIAHIYGALMETPDGLAGATSFPMVALVVSGGHTALVMLAADGTASVVGNTIDDAAGEAFDKAAKLLDLGYPGGPVIDRLAKEGNPAAVDFPRPLVRRPGHPVADENRFNFSFSGVKTALLYHVQGRKLTDTELRDVAASYQAAVVDTLVAKTLDAAVARRARSVVLCGGVACNRALREGMTRASAAAGCRMLLAPPRLCTDNAAMVAGLAYHQFRRHNVAGLDLQVSARLGASLGRLPFIG